MCFATLCGAKEEHSAKRAPQAVRQLSGGSFNILSGSGGITVKQARFLLFMGGRGLGEDRIPPQISFDDISILLCIYNVFSVKELPSTQRGVAPGSSRGRPSAASSDPRRQQRRGSRHRR